MLAVFAPILLKFLLNLLIAPWYPLVERRARAAVGRPPAPALRVGPGPRLERGGRHRATMRSVLATGYPDLELIVIDDGSTDGTREAIEATIRDHAAGEGRRPGAATVLYRSVPNGGKARALNTGLAMARGEVVVTIDADSVVDRDAIANLVRRFADPEVAAVSGTVAIGNRAEPIGLVQQLEYLYGFYFKRAEAVMGAVYIVGGAAAAYRRDVVAGLGGFDEANITEDIELSTRLQHEGHKVGYAADATVYTEGPSDLQSLCRQRLRWKHGRFLTFHKYRDLFFSTDSKHNKYLSFVVLPTALYAEVLLFFHMALLSIFYAHTFLTHDCLAVVVVAVLLGLMVCVQVASDRDTRYHRNLLPLAPVAWLMVYVMDAVEWQSLVRSVRRLATGRPPSWQRWQRVGVLAARGWRLAGSTRAPWKRAAAGAPERVHGRECPAQETRGRPVPSRGSRAPLGCLASGRSAAPGHAVGQDAQELEHDVDAHPGRSRPRGRRAG
jgi:glycosyltransferase involved in cell wall biosynthesis